MYLTGHAAVGAVIATAITTNPIAAFGIGWLSHYLVDFIPHGDEPLGEWVKRGNEITRLFIAFVPDAVLMLALLGVFTAVHGVNVVVLAAAIGSTVPDVMWGLEKLFKRRLFGPHERFHTENHNHFDIRIPFTAGLLAQGVVAGTLWWMLLG